MTNFDIISKIISEASGKPLEEVELMTDAIVEMAGMYGKIYEEVPEDKAQALLAQLRANLPGVKRWLVEGRLMVEADIAKAEGKMH